MFIYIFPFILTVTLVFILNRFFYRLISNNWYTSDHKKNLKIGILILIPLFLTFEFFLFGKNSLLIIYDEGDTFFPLYKTLSEDPISSIFFSFSGGLNRNGVMFDTKFVSLQVILLSLFNPFVGYAIIKIINAFLVVVGFWFITKNNLKHTFVLSVIYYGSLIYISTISLAHMSGYSAIPLTIFLLYQFESKSIVKKSTILLFYFIFISISSSLPHSIMVHIAGIFAGFFLYRLSKENILFCIQGILFVSFLSLINHYPAIEFVLNNKDHLFRTSQNIETLNFKNIFYHPVLELISKLRGSLIFIFGIFFIITIYLFHNLKSKIIAIICPFLLSILLDLFLTFESFSFLKTLRSEMFVLSVPSIIIIALYHFFNSKNYQVSFLKTKNLNFIILILFSYFICDTKFTHFLHWQGEGSFKSNLILNEKLRKYLVSQNIINNNSKILSNFRSVVVPTKLTPGLLWYHRINSLDGYSSFFPKKRALKWMQVFNTHLHNEQYITNRYHIKFSNFNVNIDLLNDNKINFLRSHGVRFYFSSVPLKEKYLELKYKKSFEEKTSNFFQLQISNFYRNLQNMDFYIYEDFDYEPMINIKNFKNNLVCDKNIIINKKIDQIKLDLKQCNELTFNQNYILSISLPNFEKIEVKNNSLISYFKINKELKFIVPIKFKGNQISIKPIKGK